MTATEEVTSDGPKRSLVRVGYILLGAAWAFWLLGLARAAWIESHFTRPATDVSDSLGRAWYIAQRVVAFDAAALAAGVAAGVVLLTAKPGGWWHVLAWALWIPSVLLHGLAFLVHLFFAA